MALISSMSTPSAMVHQQSRCFIEERMLGIKVGIPRLERVALSKVPDVKRNSARESIKRRRNSTVVGQAIALTSRKTVSIPCVEKRAVSLDDYLSETERIVRVAFPDSSRIRYIGSENWRATLRPVTFFTISATPVCDLRTWYENGALKIFSEKVELDFVGLPPSFGNINLQMNLNGQLGILRGTLGQKSRESEVRLEGYVDMSLSLDLPLPFSLMPELAVRSVGDAIMDGILTAMQNALLRGLIKDYSIFARQFQSQTVHGELKDRENRVSSY